MGRQIKTRERLGGASTRYVLGVGRAEYCWLPLEAGGKPGATVLRCSRVLEVSVSEVQKNHFLLFEGTQFV